MPIIKSLCQRLRVPSKYKELACIVSEYHLKMHTLEQLKSSTILSLVESTGSLRNRERAEHFALACEADARGRTGFENRPYPQKAIFFDYVDAANSVNSSLIAPQFNQQHNQGEKIKEAIRKARIKAIAEVKQAFI